MTIGQRIKARREECGLSVIELAERLGKARSTVYRYESDEILDMPIAVLEPLAAALNTTPGYLMGWTEDPSIDADQSQDRGEAVAQEGDPSVSTRRTKEWISLSAGWNNMTEEEQQRALAVIKAMYPDRFDK